MTLKISLKKSVYLLLFLLFAGLSGCSDMFKDPSKDKETGEDVTLFLMDRNFIKTRIVVHLEDYLTQEPIVNEDLVVLFDGEDASNLITFAGTKKTDFPTSSGFIEVGYDPNILVNTQNPIELTVAAGNQDYISAPQAVSYTTEGLKDIVIKMIRTTPLKSAQIVAFDEPFDLTYDGELNSSKLLFFADISGSTTGTAYEYINLYRTNASGSLVCNNLKDNVLYSDYGAYVANLLTGTGIVPPLQPIKNKTLAAGEFVYSSVLKTGMDKCDDGLTISVARSNGKSGSGVFNYRVLFSDGTTKTGMISCNFPSENLIEQIYFPSSNPAVTVELFGDAQYDMSSPVTLTSPCAKASFTATAKNNLKSYKLITRYSCPESTIGYGLTILGEFRKKGTSGKWTSFNFVGGVCELQLEANADYDFRVNMDSNYYTYTLPTDPDKVKSFLESTSSVDFKFRNLSIISNATDVSITTDVEFSAGVCDLIN